MRNEAVGWFDNVPADIRGTSSILLLPVLTASLGLHRRSGELPLRYLPLTNINQRRGFEARVRVIASALRFRADMNEGLRNRRE
jgi:hypothetical protein